MTSYESLRLTLLDLAAAGRTKPLTLGQVKLANRLVRQIQQMGISPRKVGLSLRQLGLNARKVTTGRPATGRPTHHPKAPAP